MGVRVLLVCGSLRSSSANRAALDVAGEALCAAGHVEIDDYEQLARIPPLDVDPDHGAEPVVDDWRRRIARSDAVLISAPEYAGALAGTIKNALDWIVGSGELYSKPVAVISAGTTGGHYARQTLIQTLTWQGAHVVAELGISAPVTKADSRGRFTDPVTVAAIRHVATLLAGAPHLPAKDRLALVDAVVQGAAVDPGHIAPVV